MSTLTITLTNRPPVKINKDDWPLLASASDDWNDDRSGTGTQAIRATKWRVTVRAHADGRKVVYAVYDHTTRYQSERDASYRGGELLAADDDVVAAILRVCADMQERVGGDDGAVWARLAQECIADLPAESI